MFCPKCRAEFREGFTRCGWCDVQLVEEQDLPPEEEPDELVPEDPDSEDERSWPQKGECPPDAVQVFESCDPFLVTAAGDLLHENDIPFFVRHGEMGKAFPSAIFGSGNQQAVDPAQFLVLPDREAEARAVLEDFLTGTPEDGQAIPDLPPELAEATDDPDPESDDDPVEDEADRPDAAEPYTCPNCGAELNPTDGDLEDGRTPCRACGKMVDLDPQDGR